MFPAPPGNAEFPVPPPPEPPAFSGVSAWSAPVPVPPPADVIELNTELEPLVP